MDWERFKRKAPELAEQTEELFGRNGLALIGTLRRDGSPRISPVEVFFLPDELLLGMMHRSKKALDLIRDPRCVLHNTISDPNGLEPELKLYGRAIAGGRSARARYRRAYASRWGRAAPSSFPGHVFIMQLDRLALVRYDTEKSVMFVRGWDEARGLRESKRRYP